MYHREDTGIHPRVGSLCPTKSLATANKLNCKFPPSSRGWGGRNALPGGPITIWLQQNPSSFSTNWNMVSLANNKTLLFQPGRTSNWDQVDLKFSIPPWTHFQVGLYHGTPWYCFVRTPQLNHSGFLNQICKWHMDRNVNIFIISPIWINNDLQTPSKHY